MLEVTSLLGFSIRLGIAIILGFIVGFERQWTRHPAGILTNVIVCMGSFLFCSFSMILGNDVDPTRVAAQVVSGIGFLGAGVILREGLNIRGLNTAATIWATSAIGVLCCLHDIRFAIIGGVAIVFCHIAFHPVAKFITEKRFKKETIDSERNYSISVICTDEVAPMIREKLMFIIKSEDKILLKNLETKDEDDDKVKIKAYISSLKNADNTIEKILTLIGVEENVMASGWKTIDS